MTSTTRTALLLTAALLALHLPFLPASLEDLDSINFALGLRDFEVAEHRPHPPGYPVYIAVAKLVDAAMAPLAWLGWRSPLSSESHALGIVSLLGAVAAVWALVALLTHWSTRDRVRVANVGALLTVTSPLFWMTAVRPLSDMLGLAFALAAQALTVRAATVGEFIAAAFVAGFGAGVRSQVVWLTLPLLGLAVWSRPTAERRRTGLAALAAYGVGALLWAIPLMVLSGGPAAYLRALASQGGEDFTGVAMLATQPSPRLLLAALYATWLAPWGVWPIGAMVLLTAVYGAARLLQSSPRRVVWVLVAFGPYALFHLVFQETATTRYALPLVVPVAFLAAIGMTALPGRRGLFLAGVAAIVGVSITQPALWLYSRVPAPAFRVLDDMQTRASSAGAPDPRPVLAMHRRQELDMRRPLLWNQRRVPQWSADLGAPPKHEWLELVRYWNGGGRAPVWFLADPPRSDLRLIDPRARVIRGTYRWPFEASALLGGVRPNVMDWYEIDLPGWYAGEGWALTPETAGVARDEGKGPGRAPIQAWVRRRTGPVTLMVGGRKLTGAEPTQVDVAIDGRPVWGARVAPGFFLQFVPLDAGALAGSGDYAELTIRSSTDEVAIEQFDVQPVEQAVFGFGEGWQESEYDPPTGRLWRWSSERAVIRVVTPRRALSLHLDGEFETSARTAHIVLKAGERVVAERDVPRRFTLDIPIPADVVADGTETQLVLETDQWYVPAETNWRPSQDRRHLGLRLFECELR